MKKKILITRPQPDADLLAKALWEMGYETLIEPMLHIEQLPVAVPDLNDCEGLIFTSANGVRSFRALCDIRDKPVFTVGDKTAADAKQAGFRRVQSAGQTVMDLAQALNKKKGVYVHCRGQDTSHSLKALLSHNKKITINDVVLYKAQKTAFLSESVLKALKNNEISCALFYSRRTANAFVDVIHDHDCTPYIAHIKALCLADSMIESLSVLPWKEIQLADEPTQEAMFTLLKKIETKL